MHSSISFLASGHRSRLEPPSRRSRATTMLVLLALSSHVLFAQPGTLDTSFGVLGSNLVFFDLGDDFSDQAFDVALQPDGKVILVGSADVGGGQFDFSVARIEANGFLDATFGTGGRATFPFDLGGSLWDLASSVVVAPDGKIVVGGWINGPTSNDFGVLRLDSAGNLDPTFSGDGKATVAFDLGGNNSDILVDVLLQPDGKMVLVGGSSSPSSTSRITVARLLSNGTLDTTFSGDGKVDVSFPGSTSTVPSKAILQSDGKIVVAGATNVGTVDFAVVRLTDSGSLDTGFDGDGLVAVDFGFGGSFDAGLDIAIDTYSHIVVVGRAPSILGDDDFALIRLTPTGALDITFSGDGKATVAFDLGDDDADLASAVAIQPDGKVVVAGIARVATDNNDFVVARLREDGNLDIGFGTGGKATFGFELGQNNDDRLNAIALRPNGGGILAVGSVQRTAAGDTDFGFVQWRGDQLFADGFESGDTSAW